MQHVEVVFALQRTTRGPEASPGETCTWVKCGPRVKWFGGGGGDDIGLVARGVGGTVAGGLYTCESCHCKSGASTLTWAHRYACWPG